MSVSRLCAFVWNRMTQNLEKPSDYEMRRAKLWQPPVGSKAPIPKESPWSAESEMAAFKAFASVADPGRAAKG